MSRSHRRKIRKPMAEINVVPYIDVMKARGTRFEVLGISKNTLEPRTSNFEPRTSNLEPARRAI